MAYLRPTKVAAIGDGAWAKCSKRPASSSAQDEAVPLGSAPVHASPIGYDNVRAAITDTILRDVRRAVELLPRRRLGTMVV